MKTTVHLVDSYKINRKEIFAYRDYALDQRAEYALQLLEKHALVAGAPDGEDSAGRQKGRVPTSQELVTKAFDVADLAFREIEKRGWAMAAPPLSEIMVEGKDED